MRLSTETINKLAQLIEARFDLQTLKNYAQQYKDNNLSFVRFSANVFFALKQNERDDAIKLTNGVEMIGGYFTNVTDANIETATKKALLQYANIKESDF